MSTKNPSSVVASLSTLERLLSSGEKDVEQWHSVVTKIHHLISIQDACRRDFLAKKYSGVELLLSALQVSTDGVLLLDVIQIFDEIAKNGKGCLVLVRRGTVPVVMKLLNWVAKRTPHDKQLINSIHILLIKVASKEKQFGLKARLSGILAVPLAVVQQAAVSTIPRGTLLPALQLVKLVATKGVNATFLGKQGAVTALMKMIRSSGSSDLKVLKAALEALAAVTTSKVNASKVCSNGGIKALVDMLSEWHHHDKDNRQVALRKSLLTVLNHATAVEAGQRALLDCDGMVVLFEFLHLPTTAKDVKQLVTLALFILRRCCPKQPLPVTSSKHCISFALPLSSGSSSAHSGISKSSSSQHEDARSLECESSHGGSMNGEVDSDETNCCPTKSEISGGEDDVSCCGERIDSCTGSSSDGLCDSEADKSIWRWEVPIDLSVFNCFFMELDIAEASTKTCESVDLSPLQTRFATESQLLCTKLSKWQTGYLHRPTVTAKDGWFCTVASPETYGHVSPIHLTPLHKLSKKDERLLLVEHIERIAASETLMNRVVFDLDELASRRSLTETAVVCVESQEETVVASQEPCHDQPLKFESRFESGNLRKAIQVRMYEYDLILNPDINSDHHHQWFYFEVSNMEVGVPYRFNIVNCEKPNSQFNFGMQPVVYSTHQALSGSPCWTRSGQRVSYYRNNFSRLRSDGAQTKSTNRSYYTLTFTLIFPFGDDICYVAYHYPYTYTSLQAHLAEAQSSLSQCHLYFSHQTLCTTLAGNRCDLLTITSPVSDTANSISAPHDQKKYVFLTARVHPGESNASWLMKGVLDFLLSTDPSADELRDQFIFKIVPMLNPDGVINGSHRCSLSGQDLNRCWINPDPILQPTIYHTKALLQYLLTKDKGPLIYCDFHGHSRKKGVFIYGCSSTDSDRAEEMVPYVLSQTAPLFEHNNCSFSVEKSKEAAARVVVWRQMGVQRSYTMESTYCGAETGIYKGSQVTTEQLEVMGKLFCQALLCLQNELHPTESFSSLCEEPMAQAVATDGRDSCCCSDDDDYSLATEFDQFDESVASKSDERCLDHTQYDDTDT